MQSRTQHAAALLIGLVCVAACTEPPQASDRTATSKQAFASAGAVLVDLELDAQLIINNDNTAGASPDTTNALPLIEAQLMYLVGQLNEDRAVGQHGRAEIAITSVTPVAASHAYAYHAKIPVAWGGQAEQIPTTYAVTLPARVDDASQLAFAARYASACTDPEGGVSGAAADAGRMFLFFRPQQAGCAFDATDVVSTTAQITKAATNTSGKYPEYHRVWKDDALNVVAVFGREFDVADASVEDPGTEAYKRFLRDANKLLGTTATEAEHGGLPAARLTAHVAGSKRSVQIEAILVPPALSDNRTSFDDWYDARTLDADLVIYSGHAGLGSNVRALSKKGAFRAQHYVVMAFNGCDTLAYVDHTLADRRTLLNPEDPTGTRYMDTISNVLGGYFTSGDATSLKLINAFISAAATPQTYEQIFSGVDPTQLVVVTGEEDNEFQPEMMTAPATRHESENENGNGNGVNGREATKPSTPHANGSGCSAGDPSAPYTGTVALLTLLTAILFHRRMHPIKSMKSR